MRAPRTSGLGTHPRADEPNVPSKVRELIEILGMVSPAASSHAVRLQRYTADLTVGTTLDEDLVSPKGIRLVPPRAEVTPTLMIRLISIAGGVGVAEPFRVRVEN